MKELQITTPIVVMQYDELDPTDRSLVDAAREATSTTEKQSQAPIRRMLPTRRRSVPSAPPPITPTHAIPMPNS